MFIQSEEQFEDYSCPTVAMNPQMKTYLDMAEPMKMMLKNMNKGEDSPMLEIAFEAAVTFAKVSSIFSAEYDGGEFCRGLLFSKEASKIVFAIGNQLMGRMTQPQLDAPVRDSKKTLALQSKLYQ